MHIQTMTEILLKSLARKTDKYHMGVGRLIDPDAGQRVVHICQGDNLCGDRDILPDQTVRVAPAVIPLVAHFGTGTDYSSLLHLHLPADFI